MVGAIEHLSNHLSVPGNKFQLSAEEELAAFERGDIDLLARSQLLWIVNLATRMSRKHSYQDLDGLISAGYCALMLSIKKFDPSRSRLTTYVARQVTWSLWEEMALQQQGVGPSKWVVKSNDIQFRVTTWGDDPPSVYADDIEQGNIDQIDFQRAFLKKIRTAINKLPKRQAKVIRLRFLESMTLQAIGNELGITRQAVQQAQVAGIANLRKLLA